MIKPPDYTIDRNGRPPADWDNFFYFVGSEGGPDSRVIITFEGLEPPRDTHQSRVRIFRNRAGKVFIGKRKPSAETRLFLDALTSAILRLRADNHPALAAIKSAPVCLRLGLFYSYPKSTSKAKASVTRFKTTRPDADNLVKTIQDALTVREVFEDDSQVCCLEVRKYHSPRPGIVLSIEPLPI